MPLSSSYRAALRAKKALANGNTSFKPRGEKNKAAFQTLGKHDAQTHISVSDESPPPKKMKITILPPSSSHTLDLASLLDLNPENISNNSDEEEEQVEQTAAMLAKIKTRREQIKKREENMKTELSKTPFKPWAFRLPPKTTAQLRIEEEEDAKRERIRLSTQIFKLAHELKQFDVLHVYKTFEKQEDLLEWLQDVVEQKQAGFKIEDDDS